MFFLKKYWLNGSLWNQKWLFYGITWRTFWSTSIFKSILATYSMILYNIYIT